MFCPFRALRIYEFWAPSKKFGVATATPAAPLGWALVMKLGN